MTYTPKFTRPATGGYDGKKGFCQVRVGSDAYLLEDELNEMQAILNERITLNLTQLVGQGVMQPVSCEIDPRPNVVKITAFNATVAGFIFTVLATDYTDTPELSTGHGSPNFFQLGEKPSSGTRTDMIILEVYLEEVAGDQTLYAHGNQKGKLTVPNDLIDSRIGAETSRRVQVKKMFRVIEGYDSTHCGSDLYGNPFYFGNTGLLYSNGGHYGLCLFSFTRSSTETALPTPVPQYTRASFNATQWIADQSLGTSMLQDAAVTTAKLADQSVAAAKLGSDVLYNQGLGAPADLSGMYGMIPVLRFFAWNSLSAPYPLGYGGRYASDFANRLADSYAFQWFTGIQYMSQRYSSRTMDPNVLLTLNGSGSYGSNISVICMKNVTSTDQVFTIGGNYSSYGATYAVASASVAYQIYNPASNGKPTGSYVNFWEDSTDTVANRSFSVTVPAGNVIVFVLKTSPKYNITASGTACFYFNVHGLFLTDAVNSSFKPHLETYRFLLSGK